MQHARLFGGIGLVMHRSVAQDLTGTNSGN